ncbi:hapless 8 [Abeliophyllum distichum]|uniref:Hapless 8 n=1 Tax=Abeliophyllum distichum TaxID=126358 RepID=A0ABD1QI67_9LAMI
MLSIENPPPDTQCACEISQLKSSNSHERASDNKQQLEVDLSKFSIRDYVFNTRSKDIKTNWPFSQKNLQLCLKHGMTNLLPPFQSLGYARNSSIEKCAVGSIARDKESTSNSNGKLSCSSDHLASVSYTNIGHGHNLSVDCGDINASGSQEEKEFPSTTASHSYSERDTVPTIQSPCLEAEAKKFPGPLPEEPVSVLPSSNKSQSTIKETVKKCRLIVKLSSIADPRLQEDTAANTSVVSETMASKVCPVCKTFSSSSNTTLNAHIDQCLSGESTIKCTENPKVIKHRIKPRKTRLMVDIYATAKHFTLQDLDRRNGTNWASSLGFPASNMEMSVEDKNMTPSPADVEDIDEDAAVYIDSNGTKLRILSKFNDLQSNSNAKDDCRPSKLEKRDKESKLSSSKKSNLIRKHKLMKCAPHDQHSCFLRHDHCHEIDDSEQRNIPPEESCEKDECLTKPLKACDQMKLNNFGMIRQWVGSKRTGLMKKINLEGEDQHSDKGVAKDLRLKSNQSSLADPFLKRTSSLSSAVLSDQNPQSPPESSKRQENLSLFSHDGCKDPFSRKTAGFSLSDSRNCHSKKKKRLMLSKCSVKQLRKDGPSVLDRITDPPNCTENLVPPRSNRKTEMLSPAKNSRSSFINSRSSQHHAYSSGGKKFSSLRNISLDHGFSSRGNRFSALRKDELSVSKASIPDHSKKNLKRKCLDQKNTGVHYMSGSDEEALESQSAIVRQHHLVEDLCENTTEIETTDKLFVDRTRVLKIQKKRGEFMICRKEETKALKSSQHSPESDSGQAGKKIDSFIGDSVPPCTSDDMESSGKEVDISDDIVCEPIPDMADGGTFMVFSKSLNPAFPVLAGTSDVQGLSQQYLEANKEPFLDKPVLGGEEMFCGDEVGKLNITHNVHMVADLDTNEEPGNYFVDVDPIPIPGPPGSFLPSPGRMGSEDLHGNSSLTSCRVQSSDDEHELIDMDSSDSPVSAASAISDSIAARSYSVSLGKLSLEPDHGVQPETRSSFSRASNDHVVESSSPFEQAASAGEGKLNLDQSRADLMFAESSPLRFKNSQPCCCSRKEGALSGVALNYQESQLLRRRTMSSLVLPAIEKQMGGYAKRKFEMFQLEVRSSLYEQVKFRT